MVPAAWTAITLPAAPNPPRAAWTGAAAPEPQGIKELSNAEKESK
jgi:hypothetical protein